MAIGRAGRAVTLGTLCFLTLGACGDGDSSAEDEVLAAYFAFWDAFFEAADPPNPDHPALERVATGEQLERLRELFAEDLRESRVRRGGPEFHPEVTELTEDSATVRDCYLDAAGIYDSDTGERLDPGDEYVLALVTLISTDGVWKVAETSLEVGGCTG